MMLGKSLKIFCCWEPFGLSKGQNFCIKIPAEEFKEAKLFSQSLASRKNSFLC